MGAVPLPFNASLPFLSLLLPGWPGFPPGSGQQLDPGDTDSDEEILEWILEMPLQNNCSKALFSIPEVAEEEEEEESWAHVLHPHSLPPSEKRVEGQGALGEPPVNAQPQSPLHLQEQSLPGTGISQECRRSPMMCSAPELPNNWTWAGVKQPSRSRAPHWQTFGQAPLSPKKRKAASRRDPPLPHRPAVSGGLYRAHSLKENLDVISSLGEVAGGSGLGSWTRLRHPLRHTTKDSSPLGPGPEEALLEIDVEYDSDEEQDRTLTSSLPSSDSWPSDEEEGWSEASSSHSGSAPSSGPRGLRRCSSWEDESTEWSCSPGHSPSHSNQAKGRSEERSRSLERSPALWRAQPQEHPGKGRPPAPAWVSDLPAHLPASARVLVTTTSMPHAPCPPPATACALCYALPWAPGLCCICGAAALGVAVGVSGSRRAPLAGGPYAGFLFSAAPGGTYSIRTLSQSQGVAAPPHLVPLLNPLILAMASMLCS